MHKLLIAVLLICLVPPFSGFAQAETPDEIIRLLNEERLELGLSPLRFNSDLFIAAARHSADIATQEQLSHTGSDGTEFWQRILDTGYELQTGAENVLMTRDLSPVGILEQWRMSPLHYANLINPDYKDIAVGISPGADDQYYVVLVLADSVNADSSSTPMPAALPSPTVLTPAATATMPPQPANVQTVVEPTLTIIPPVVFSPSVTPPPSPMPMNSEPDIRLIYDEGSFSLVNISGRPLDLRNIRFENQERQMPGSVWDTEFLTQPLSGFTSGDCLQVWYDADAFYTKPARCRYRHAWVVVPEESIFWTEGEFLVRNGDQIIALCASSSRICEFGINDTVSLQTNAPTSTPQVAPGADIRLIYDESSLTLINISGVDLDLRPLRFVSERTDFLATIWSTPFLTRPLDQFPDGDCLQVWSLDVENVLDPPASCQIRHGWVAVGEPAIFWDGTSAFRAIYGDITVGMCYISEGSCSFTLAPLGDPIVVPTNTSAGSAVLPAESDILLVIDPNGVVLKNTSGRLLDLSNLRFESDSGSMTALSWLNADLSRALDMFTPDDCLEVWSLEQEYRERPDFCRYRHGWVKVSAESQFWRANVFRVMRSQEQIADCESRAGRCTFNLP